MGVRTGDETKAAPDARILTTDFDWSMLRRAIDPLRHPAEPIRGDCVAAARGTTGGPRMTDIAVRSRPVAAPGRRSLIASIVSVLVPYALVGLGLRLLMAYEIFREGQSKIDGMLLNFNVSGTQFSVVLPVQVKPSLLQLFESHFAGLEVPTWIIAHVYAYAEFLLPICLVLGFITRFSSLVLLILTVLTAVYVAPEELWTTYIYWIAILLVLLSAGPGALSFDALIRFIYQRDKTPEFR
jgi:putative oxidoreductase